jgi:2-oxoglutarate dehydrogenase E2 component (dihydrolipoamide succinyltransferase)
MATEVVMPQMGESIAEGTITKWLVKIGDKVERDQPLFEISTDKVDAEIPSPAAGVLLEIRNQEGETVPVNQVVATIGEAGEAAGAAAPAAAATAPAAGAGAPAAAAAPAPPAGAAAPAAPAQASAPAAGAASKPAEPSAPAPAPASAPAPSSQLAAAAPEKQAAPGAETAAHEETSREGAAAGDEAAAREETSEGAAAASGGAGASGPRRVPSPAAPAAPAAAGAAAAEESQEVRRDQGESDLARESDREEVSEGERLRRFSSPLVRSIAAKEGVDLQEVAGTGAQGRVTKGDILSFLEQRRTAPAPAPARPAAVPPPPAAAPPAAAAPQPLRPTGGFYVPAYVEGENVEIEPMSKIRQITAAHMVYSKATSAHVTTIFDFDMSRVARIRARAKDNFARKEGTKLTFMPFIFKAVVNGLKAHRKVNASIDGTNIVYKKDINLGMAVDLGHGLIVPVIKHADHLNLIGLAKAANDLAERARGKKLKPEEVQGGTFTITNPGVFGSLFGTPIINQPQVAILGVGAIEKRPVVVEDADGNDSLSIRTRCYFGITYDHRLVDGADADRFMVDLKKTLETDTWTELEPYV